SCLDFPITHDPAEYVAIAKKAADIAPRMGSYYATLALPCALWAEPATPAPHAPVAAGAAPILVIGATLDTQDPYSWAVDLTGQLDSEVLLTREGSGHPSFFESLCVEQAVADYLIDLTLPAPGMVCDSTGGVKERFQ